MLTEDMRIIAGLQESKHVDNPLPMLLEIEKQEKIQRINRDLNSKKNVTTHFETFKENITKYYEMIESIKTLCENQYSQEFISGLFEARYNAIEKFANIVINENISVVFQYLDEHYNSIKNELEKIKKINEIIDIENAPTYFVTHEIYSDDAPHHLNIKIYKNKTLEEHIDNMIPYGAEIIYISEELTIIRHSGKKFYTKLTKNEINLLEVKKFLI